MFIERRFYNDPVTIPGTGPAVLVPDHQPLAVRSADLRRLIEAHAELGRRHRQAGAARKRLLTEGVSDLVLAERTRQGWRLPSEKVLEVFALDIELNAQGLESWLDSEGK